MKRENYDKIRAWFLRTPRCLLLLRAAYKGLPLIVATSYPLCLLLCFLYQRELFLRAVIVPALLFLLITLIRHQINFPRPYEREKIIPLIQRQKKGHSFPSRHTASAGIIAAVWMAYWYPAGITMIMITFFIAVSRVLAGVHDVRDVAFGGVVGFIAARIFFIFP